MIFCLFITLINQQINKTMESYVLYPTKSAPGEFYVCTSPATKGMAGQLQYKLNRGQLNAVKIDHLGDSESLDVLPLLSEVHIPSSDEWTKIDPEEYRLILPQLVPKTPTGGKPEDWNILVAWRTIRELEIWIKAALFKTDAPDLIAVMTATNSKNNIINRGTRAIQSHADKWFIGHYRMSAPLVFWADLRTKT